MVLSLFIYMAVNKKKEKKRAFKVSLGAKNHTTEGYTTLKVSEK